jgi:Tfp pilus assembly protein PilO
VSRHPWLFIVTAIGLCLYAGFLLIVLCPLVERVESNDKLIAALVKQTDLAGQSSELTENAREAAEKMRLRHEDLDRKAPHGTGNAEMIVILTTLAEKHNLRQIRISENRPRPGLPGKEISDGIQPGSVFLWQGSGYYQDIKDFLKDLEECGRLLEIRDINLTEHPAEEPVPTPEGTDPATEPLPETEQLLDVSLQIKTYYDPSDPGAEPTGLFPAIPEETEGTTDPFRAN